MANAMVFNICKPLHRFLNSFYVDFFAAVEQDLVKPTESYLTTPTHKSNNSQERYLPTFVYEILLPNILLYNKIIILEKHAFYTETFYLIKTIKSLCF